MSTLARKVRSQLSWLLYLTPLVAIGPVSTDLYLPSMPEMGRSLSAPEASVQMTLSAFLIGFALSQLVTGALSDRFGRRPVILGGMALYLVASLVCAFAPNIDVLIAARFMQAFGSCTGSVLGRAIVRDVYTPKESLKVMSALGAAMALAPALAPIIGSWLLEFFGWHANFFAMAIFGFGLLGATLLTYEETNQYRGQTSISPIGIAKNFWTLLQNNTFRGYGGTMALMFGGMFSFISGASIVLINDLGLTPQECGYAFSTLVLGFGGGSIIVGKLSQIYSGRIIVAIGTSIALLSGGVLLALALGGVHTVWALLVPNMFYTFGVGITMPTCMAASIGPFPRLAGSAASLIGFGQGILAAFAGWLVGQLYDHTALGIAISVFAFSLAMFLLYWLQAHTAPDGISE